MLSQNIKNTSQKRVGLHIALAMAYQHDKIHRNKWIGLHMALSIVDPCTLGQNIIDTPYEIAPVAPKMGPKIPKMAPMIF